MSPTTATKPEPSALDSAWQPIGTAPRDGTRVRVAHSLDPHSLKIDADFGQTFGSLTDGRWRCNNAFICIDGWLRWEPDLWLPATEQVAK